MCIRDRFKGGDEIVEVAVGAPSTDADASGYPATTAHHLPVGISAAEAQRRLHAHSGATVLRLTHARGLLCGLDGALDARAFNQLAGSLLKPPSWCAKCYQPCKRELARWLDAEVIAKGWRTEGREEFWCSHFEPPPPLSASGGGACV